MPVLTVIAGPNGAGKSTLTSSIWFEGNENLIDPDFIARRIDINHPASKAIPAAREAIHRCQSMLAARESFTLETTLAGNGAMRILQQANSFGYRTILVYVSLGDPELHIKRVQLRVAQGGHDIPIADILRRYRRSLKQAAQALALADEAIVLDNSGLRPEKVLAIQNGSVEWRSASLPEWARKLAESLGAST